MPGSTSDAPSSPPRFVVDAHLGRLARYLRMLGFDAVYGNDPGDPLLASLAQSEERVLLTRDRFLLEHRLTGTGHLVESTEPEPRLREVVEAFDLGTHVDPFTRCLRCNTPLEPVEKSAVIDRLQPRTAASFDEFYLCPTCDQVLWRGSHYDRMKALAQRVLSGPDESAPQP